MKKQKLVLLSLLLVIFALSNLSGQSWQIFRPDYTLNTNLVNLQKKIGTKQPIDVIVSKDGIVWLQKSVKLTTSRQNKLTTSCRMKLTTSCRTKLTT